MEEMKCTYNPFVFSLRALLLRRIFCLLAHPVMFTLPLASLAVSFVSSNPSEAAAAAFLMLFGLILIHLFRDRVLARLDALARKDAKALRLRDSQRYIRIRHQQFPQILSRDTESHTLACFLMF